MRFLLLPMLLLSVALFAPACSNNAPPEGEAVRQRDSLPAMITEGVSKIISDSGIARYKIITEEWRVYDKTKPPRQEFRKGIFLERFDNNRVVDLYLTADTAYCYDQNLWKLRGNVVVRNEADGTIYRSQELFWNMQNHEFYSSVPMHLVTPDRELRGNRFRSNEQLTSYEVINTSGHIPMPRSTAAPPPPPPADSAQRSKS